MAAIYSILNHALDVTGAASSSSFRRRHLRLRRPPSIASFTPHVHLPHSTTAFCLKLPRLRLLQPASLLLLLRPRFSASSGCHHIYDQDVAIKVFSKQEFTEEAIYSFRQEVSLMKRLIHPNILLFMGAVTSPQHLCIVTEFLPRGSLFRLLQRNTSKLDWRRRIHMALDIVPMLLSIGEEDLALTKVLVASVSTLAFDDFRRFGGVFLGDHESSYDGVRVEELEIWCQGGNLMKKGARKDGNEPRRATIEVE